MEVEHLVWIVYSVLINWCKYHISYCATEKKFLFLHCFYSFYSFSSFTVALCTARLIFALCTRLLFCVLFCVVFFFFCGLLLVTPVKQHWGTQQNSSNWCSKIPGYHYNEITYATLVCISNLRCTVKLYKLHYAFRAFMITIHNQHFLWWK